MTSIKVRYRIELSPDLVELLARFRAIDHALTDLQAEVRSTPVNVFIGVEAEPKKYSLQELNSILEREYG